jgi:HD-like signal output (HDOD) protein
VASVIRLANISMRGTGKSISSVEHAVIVVGQEGLRQLITSVAFRPIIDMNSGQYTRNLAPRIWDRAERTAVANKVLAESMGVDPFEAFLAGLVQNVGLIVTLRIMDQAAKDGDALGSPMFVAKLIQDARTLTCSIGKEWNFPDNVTLAVSEQGAMGKKAAHMSPLGRLLALNDYLGKLRILVDNGRAERDDPLLFKGLPPQAELGYDSLGPLDEE